MTDDRYVRKCGLVKIRPPIHARTRADIKTHTCTHTTVSLFPGVVTIHLKPPNSQF